MDSINLCKLEEYVVAQIKGEDISHCRDRKQDGSRYVGVDLPDVVGKRYTDAVAALKAAGLIPLPPELGNPAPDKDMTGKVEKVKASRQGELQPGDSITLVVFDEPKLAEILPNLVGLPANKANEIARQAGFIPEFKLGKETRDPKQNGMTYQQTPVAGTPVEAGSQVVITIYSFVEDTLKVPDLTGLPIAEAQRILKNMGLQLSATLDRAAPKTSDEDKVSKQNPGPGADIDAGATVTLWVYGKHENPAATAQTKNVPDETATEYCALGKANFAYQADRDYFVFRKREPRRITSRSYAREYSFLPDNARNVEAAVQQIKQEGKLELVFKGRLPGLCDHLRKNCALSSMNHADGSFFGDICGKWADPPPVYVSQGPATLPDLRGMTLVKAQKALQDMGLTISPELGEPAKKQGDVSRVYKQSPKPGIDVQAGIEVTVWVYGEIEKAEEKVVTGEKIRVPLVTVPLMAAGVPRNYLYSKPRFNFDKTSRTVNVDTPSLYYKYLPERYEVEAEYKGPDQWVCGDGVRRGIITRDSIKLRIRWLEPGDDVKGEKSIQPNCNSQGLDRSIHMRERSRDCSSYSGWITLHSRDSYSSVLVDFSLSDESKVPLFKQTVTDMANMAIKQIEPYAKSCQEPSGHKERKVISLDNVIIDSSGGGRGLGGCGGLFGADACK
jgi:beta-lactam-binding protein with PASTA domain